jgi:2-polyprenyl-6-methoxyphenol hydroxylase-like FAD-dependent oxidoreductase
VRRRKIDASMDRLETSVLVVGAGPVGLSLSLELARLGTACVLVDQGEGVVIHPRGTGVSERTMEYFRRWGIIDAIRAGYSDDLPLNQVFCSSMGGYVYGVAHYPSLGEWPTPTESPHGLRRCSQDWWDRTILSALQDQARADIRYLHRYESLLSNEAGGVIAVVRDLARDEEIEVNARYLAACDGVDSQIRHELGIDRDVSDVLFTSMSILFEAHDLFAQVVCEPGERFILTGPAGPVGNVTSVDGRSLWRLLVRGGEERFDLDTFDADAHVRRALGRDDVDFRILSLRPWRNQQWLAQSYRRASALLVGDAAHQMSPAGGHGANTGITDAVNLAWKLNAVLDGWGGERLLESYEAERRPVAARNSRFAVRNTRAWSPTQDISKLLDDTAEGAEVRQSVGEELLKATKSEWESIGVALGYRYEDSPVILSDGIPFPPDDPSRAIQTSRPGSRAPHVWIGDGRSTLDLYGDGMTLLVLDDTDVSLFVRAAQNSRTPLRVEDLSENRAIDALRDVYEQPLTLVRPDGHVAWRAAEMPDNIPSLLDVACGRG